jgi:DNA repair protein RadC
MKITEYKIIHDNQRHPQLMEAHTYNWRGKNFESYDNIVKMLNSCFYMNKLNEEYVYVLAFDWGLNLKGVFELSHGSTKSSLMRTKELYIFLLLTGADQFIVAHNHPNGNLGISEEDNRITSDVNAFTAILGINMLESIIISRKGYTLIQETQRKNEIIFTDFPKLERE